MLNQNQNHADETLVNADQQRPSEQLLADRYLAESAEHLEECSRAGWDRAWNAIKKALEAAPDYRRPCEIALALLLSDHDFSSFNCSKKLDVLTAILRSHPRDARALCARALVHTVLGELEKAKNDYEQAQQSDPQSVASALAVEVWCKDGSRIVAVYPTTKWGELCAGSMELALCSSLELQEGLLGKNPDVTAVGLLAVCGTTVKRISRLDGLLGTAEWIKARHENDDRE